MTPQEMERRIKELENWKEQRERQQLTNPLDVTSQQALNQAFINALFLKLSTGSLLFRTGASTNPSKEGEVVYHDSSKTLKVFLNGAVKTITAV